MQRCKIKSRSLNWAKWHMCAIGSTPKAEARRLLEPRSHRLNPGQLSITRSPKQPTTTKTYTQARVSLCLCVSELRATQIYFFCLLFLSTRCLQAVQVKWNVLGLRDSSVSKAPAVLYMRTWVRSPEPTPSQAQQGIFAIQDSYTEMGHRHKNPRKRQPTSLAFAAQGSGENNKEALFQTCWKVRSKAEIIRWHPNSQSSFKNTRSARDDLRLKTYKVFSYMWTIK